MGLANYIYTKKLFGDMSLKGLNGYRGQQKCEHMIYLWESHQNQISQMLRQIYLFLYWNCLEFTFLPYYYIVKSEFSQQSKYCGTQDLIQGIRLLQNHWKCWLSEGQREPLVALGKSGSANCLWTQLPAKLRGMMWRQPGCLCKLYWLPGYIHISH